MAKWPPPPRLPCHNETDREGSERHASERHVTASGYKNCFFLGCTYKHKCWFDIGLLSCFGKLTSARGSCKRQLLFRRFYRTPAKRRETTGTVRTCFSWRGRTRRSWPFRWSKMSRSELRQPVRHSSLLEILMNTPDAWQPEKETNWAHLRLQELKFEPRRVF